MSPTQKIIRVSLLYLAAAVIIIPNLKLLAGTAADSPELLARIPSKIGAWHGKDLDDTEARAFFLVGEDTIFQPLVRIYRNSGKSYKIVLNALEDLKGFQRGIHDPRFCYESLGWTVQNFENTTVDVRQKKTTLKYLTYTNNTGSSKRMEIYGYLAGREVFTSDFDLRLAHFRNRLLKMIRKPRRHLLYLGISTELKQGSEKILLADLKFLISEIIAALTAPENASADISRRFHVASGRS